MRQATKEDIPRLVEYGRRFHRESGYAEYVTFHDERFAGFLEEIIESPRAALFVADGGFIAGVLHQMYMTFDVTAHEVFWWVVPKKRKTHVGRELKKAFENWAKEHGANVETVSTLDKTTPPQVEAGLREEGYIPMERGFIRRI